MAAKELTFGEKVFFSFRNPVAELEVKKVKTGHGPTRDYGKIEWQVTRASIPGSSLAVGEVLPTRRVYHLARSIDPLAAHAFDMENQPR